MREYPIAEPLREQPTVEIVAVTPELAEKWLGANHGNRNQRKNAIAAYARDIRHGSWLFTGESIKFDWNGRMIDGQHRCEAVVSTGVPIRSLVVRGLDPRVQSVLDTNARRTAADALRFAGVDADAKSIAAVARVARAFESGGLRFATDSLGGQNVLTNTEVLAWANANPDVASAVAFASRVARPIGSTPAGIGFAVLLLMRLDPEATIEFFSSAAELRTRGNGDPRKAMLDAFSNIRDRARRAPTQAESLSIVFRSWNSWRQGKRLSIIRSTSSDGHGGITGVSIPKPVA